ncbi:MAG: hypothetical protein HQM12_23705 [SAR324 cluster bacterium]|nr:hypothetical protein [SAR324 cluster bacterium]
MKKIVTLTQYLDEIINWLAKREYLLKDYLQHGLTELEIHHLLNKFPFQVSHEVIELYQWRNGVTAPSGTNSAFAPIYLSSYLEFMPLQSALEISISGLDELSGFYDIDFFCIFVSLGQDLVGIPTQSVFSSTLPVVEINNDGYGANIIFSSIAKMMETLLVCFQEGAVFLQEGILHSDYEKYGRIALQINPEIEYWHKYVKGEI